ncbi:universal stress protein [Salinarchaeum sp. IM2453]|uniref:universal stress protein n=1 Tax=Salinarchaeum sp. IM2453 TaxID=2862870 RepID=UPI001C83963B|nr:universal stress protein [Salinarchaeum sp. IM2453]QZA88264.1 universal stress protein [Salinarchaeum sp. IM2453]
MYDKILVPTDNSDPSRRAIEHAVHAASQSGSELHGLFVTDSGTVENLAGRYPQQEDALTAIGEDALEHVKAAGEDHGVSVKTEIVSGVAHEEIINYAEENDIDVIIMGTHGRRGIERVLMGSVTERVIKTADIPVMVIGD